ncbi:hypothetical protein ABZV78_24575, partial [Micromonospora sp. NPDC004540]
VFILGLGVIAALNQIGVATTVTTPVLIAVLATVAGILIVGVGGGLVRPMQGRWENWLTRAEQESQAIATHARAYQAGRQDLEARLGGPAGPYAEADRTQPVAPYGAAEPTQPVPAYADPDRTQPTAPRQPTAQQAADSEATMVIPQADVDNSRR